MAAQRIYIVYLPDNTTRLVRATVRSQALSHVASSLLNIGVASQDDLVKALESGVKVENAKNPDQTELDV